MEISIYGSTRTTGFIPRGYSTVYEWFSSKATAGSLHADAQADEEADEGDGC